MADCFNCKHRHHMVCIPESNDCEKVYILDDYDVFENNKERCDFYQRKDTVYDFGSMHGVLRFTRDIFDCSDASATANNVDVSTIFDKVFSFKPCIIIINGIMYDLSDSDIRNIKIRFHSNLINKIDGRNIIDISIIYEMHYGKYYHDINMVAKVVTVRYNKDTNSVIINGIEYLEEN